MIAACVQWRIGAGVTVSVFAAIQLRSTPSLQHMSERRHSTRVVDTGKWCQIYFPQKNKPGAGSTGHCGSSVSLSAGDWNPKVFLGC